MSPVQGRPIRFGIAGLALLIGGAFLWRGLSQSRPTPPMRNIRADVSREASQAQDVSFHFTLDPAQIGVPSSISVVFDRVFEQGRAELSDSRASRLAEETTAYLDMLLKGDIAAYEQYVRDRRGVLPQWLDNLNDRSVVWLVESRFEAFRMAPIDASAISVRPRVLNGRTLEAERLGLGRVAGIYARDRYPSLDGLARKTPYGWHITGDTYEVLIPMRHRFQQQDSDVVLGVWLTWIPPEDRWQVSQVKIYGPRTTLMRPPL